MAERIPARLTASEGRKFAFTVGIAFAVLGGIAWWRGHPITTSVLGGLGGILLLLGAVVPSRLGPVQQAWMGLAHAISRVTTPIFMGIVYFVVLSPIALLMRVFGKAPLRVDADATTYWTPRADDERRSDLSRQF